MMNHIVVSFLPAIALIFIRLPNNPKIVSSSGIFDCSYGSWNLGAFAFIGSSQQNSIIQNVRERRKTYRAFGPSAPSFPTENGVLNQNRDVFVLNMKASPFLNFDARKRLVSSNASLKTGEKFRRGKQQCRAVSTDTSSQSCVMRTNAVSMPHDVPVALKHLEFTPDDITDRHPPVIILHGLLGSKRNFASLGTSLSQQLIQKRRIIALDLRNHGDNHHDWRTSMRYEDMVNDVLSFLDEQGIEKAVLVGHSMGGKVAQAMALLYPHRVAGLVVIDIAPVTYSIDRDGGWKAVCQILDALRGLQNLSELGFTSKKQVDQAIREAGVDDPALRAIVLTNVELERNRSKEDGPILKWKVFLGTILCEIDTLAGFIDDTSLSTTASAPLQYHGDTFLISGGASRFVRVSHMETISKFFPNHMLTTVRGAGHWVHAEAPDDTLALLRKYLDR